MKKINDVFWLTFGVVCIGYFVYLLGKRFFTDHISEKDIRYTKAVIINHKDYDINHRATSKYTYSYSFIIDGKTYEGDSHDTSVKVGDTVKIEYHKNHPFLNKPLRYNE
ncbi:MAG: hypothetical protein M3O71_26670 [Bacteroidota bacterium]|nr:hypothetical protein [Bacteroidota bacterium]